MCMKKKIIGRNKMYFNNLDTSRDEFHDFNYLRYLSLIKGGKVTLKHE